MDFLLQIFDMFLHINRHLPVLVGNYSTLAYAIIALIIFCEVGLVVTPFLPGDSMLFVIGALCATGAMDITIVLTLFPVAAIAGDNFNRLMGVSFGHKAFSGKEGRFFNQKNFDRARSFFDKYGARAITICRFIPFFRTFVPFVAGMAGMRWRTFFLYSVLGGAGWVVVCVLAGYYFGNLEIIKGHFDLVLLTIIAISTLPAVAGYLKKSLSPKRISARPGALNPSPEHDTHSQRSAFPQARICKQILYRQVFRRVYFSKVGLAQKARDFCQESGCGAARIVFRVHVLRTRHTIRKYGDLAPTGQGSANSRRARLLCTACHLGAD